MRLMGNKVTIRDTISPSVNSIAAPLVSTNVGTQFGLFSFSYNQQYSALSSELTAKRIEYQTHVDEQLAIDPNFKGYRNNGVSLAWEYEKADILMGGTGSENFTPEQRAEILERGRVRGFEGHHIKNVANNKVHQANPDNIKFYGSREDHVEIGHNGDVNNPSDGEFIDRDRMIRDTNRRRVITNEMKGLGISAAIGFGVGVTISVIMELSRTGLQDANIPLLLKRSLISGVETAGISSITYIVGRCASYALENVFHLTPLAVTNVLSVGAISSSIAVVYQIAKMKIMGMSQDEIYDVVGKQATVSMLSVALTSLATGLYGGVGGIVASIGFTVIYLGYNIGINIHNRALNDKLRAYTVEQYRPVI